MPPERLQLSTFTMGVLLALTTCALGLPGCDGETGPTDGGVDARPDADGDLEPRADADQPSPDADGTDASPVAGSLTLVFGDGRLSLDRVCDFDGDGEADNAVADLGADEGARFAMMAQALSATDYDVINLHTLLHFPAVEDVAIPHGAAAPMVLAIATDHDHPPDRLDDLLGDESFFVVPGSVAACGEPRYTVADVVLDHGALSAGPGPFHFTVVGQAFHFREARLQGHVAPRGEAAEATVCGYLTADDLGALRIGGISWLEIFASGGAALGIPGVAGPSLDLDLDGDGLERLVLDDSGRIESCIDGDRVVIPGRDCWADARIADGMTLTLGAEAAPAVLAGPEPSWRWELGETCESFPTEPSAWGSCEAAACERWTSRSCTPECGGDGVQQCAFDCRRWGPCVPTGSESFGFSDCDDVGLEGGATCEGDPAVVQLSDGLNQRRGVRLAREVVVGRGPVTLEAHVDVAGGTSALPDWGWSLVAYVGSTGGLTSPDGPWAVDTRQLGYAAQWRFHETGMLEEESDRAYLRGLVGREYDEDALAELGSAPSGSLRPTLDSTVDGTVLQGLRLVIEPDLPETAVNEMLVTAHLAVDSGYEPLLMACWGDGCPTPIRPGDLLRVGIVTSTFAADAKVRLSAPEGLRAEAHGICP